MIKEYLIAVILGLLLGFGATGAYYSLQTGKNKQNEPVTQANIPTPPPSQENVSTSSDLEKPTQNNLVIDSPKNYTIVNNSKINITGTTSPQSLIVITTPVDSYTDKTDEKGNFDLAVTLESGFNIVQISAIDSQNIQTDLELIVTYSTANI
ncbi:hypothetical protein KJ909_00530 [Patescibacteria group bacterium]|nr:hypothetical protein [Patescibacteria group bacterium]